MLVDGHPFLFDTTQVRQTLRLTNIIASMQEVIHVRLNLSALASDVHSHQESKKEVRGFLNPRTFGYDTSFSTSDSFIRSRSA